MEKTEFQKLNQLTADNRHEKRIGNGRRNGQAKVRESYDDKNRREELRREDDIKKAEEIKSADHPPEDKHIKQGDSVNLFKKL